MNRLPKELDVGAIVNSLRKQKTGAPTPMPPRMVGRMVDVDGYKLYYLVNEARSR